MVSPAIKSITVKEEQALNEECQDIGIFCQLTCLGSTVSLLIILIFTGQLSAPIKWDEAPAALISSSLLNSSSQPTGWTLIKLFAASLVDPSYLVDVVIDIGVGAVPQAKLDMQGHPYLGDGEGGAGVLLAVAGSLMRE